MDISPAQMRAARAWLGLSQEELARRAGVAKSSVAEYERGARLAHGSTLAAVRRALEADGIVFLFDGARPKGVAYDLKEIS